MIRFRPFLVCIAFSVTLWLGRAPRLFFRDIGSDAGHGHCLSHTSTMQVLLGTNANFQMCYLFPSNVLLGFCFVYTVLIRLCILCP
jgi:hypothetical protein